MGQGLSWQQVEVLGLLADKGALPITSLTGPYDRSPGERDGLEAYNHTRYQATRRGVVTLELRGLVALAPAFWDWSPDTGMYQWSVLQEPGRMVRRLLTAWITDEGRAVLQRE